MNPTKFKETTCPRCSTSYKCYLFKNCWCEEFELSEEAMEHMQLNYDGCICEACLKEIVVQYP